MKKKLVKFSQLGKLVNELRLLGKSIVFTSGTFDLFHLGHARFISKAKSLGDVLIVGIPSNKAVEKLKGKGRPIIDERARAAVLAALETVDFVVIFPQTTIFETVKKIKANVFFTVAEDWNKDFAKSPIARLLRSYGGKIVRSTRQAPFISASKIIEKAAGEMVHQVFGRLIEIANKTQALEADGIDPHSQEVQLAAREKGFYDQVLAAVAKRGKCVFCELKEKYLVAEKDGVVLTVALFPYIDGHLLVIPRRHLESMGQLNKNEQEAVFVLAKRAKEILKKKLRVENVWFLLREGQGINAGKTVEHLHFHLIPYDPMVIKMGEKKLKATPLEMARKLKKE